MLANPDIIAHNGITLQRQFIFHWSNGTSPVATNDIKTDRLSHRPSYDWLHS